MPTQYADWQSSVCSLSTRRSAATSSLPDAGTPHIPDPGSTLRCFGAENPQSKNLKS